MERVRLDQHALQIHLAKELPQHRPLVVLTSGVAGLTDRHAQGCRVERYLGVGAAFRLRLNAEPPPMVGSIEPRSVLPSQTS